MDPDDFDFGDDFYDEDYGDDVEVYEFEDENHSDD